MTDNTMPLAWNPRTEKELLDAADSGLLEETHYLDLKRQLPPPGRSASKSIATDLAAMAPDGGIILVGIDEDTTPPSLVPFELDGVAERIEQIGRTVPDGPVQVRITVIQSATPGWGYLAVHIPKSPSAPHMVEGRYMARGDKENRRLTDAEVLRYHEARIADRKDTLAAAESILAQRLAGEEDGAALVVVATPVGVTDGLLVALTESTQWQPAVVELVAAACKDAEQDFMPSLLNAYQAQRQSNGVAVTRGAGAGIPFGLWDERAEVLFTESGELVLVSERPSDRIKSEKLAMEVVILGQVELVARLAAEVAQRYGFTGTWRFALAVRGLKDARSYALRGDMIDVGSVYGIDTYGRAAEATLLDLSTRPRGVVEALVRPLLRSLGSHTKIAPSYFGG